ncbi:(4Fe-4S)-binding protein, partial [Candidatus Poribacteria bacterium]
MRELTADMVKEFARSKGADLVGIASIDRFEGAPPQMDPKQIFPRARSVIVIAVRIPRGCYRGIHEGTFWASYMVYGYK